MILSHVNLQASLFVFSRRAISLFIEIFVVSFDDAWLLTNDKELFLSLKDFPWFYDIPVGKILAVKEPPPGHFYLTKSVSI